MNLTYATTASGINAPGIWHELGWKPVFHSEIDPWASAVLRYREPDVPNLGDMLALDPAPWKGKVDVFCAGTPCQAFSQAGLRGSLDDDRGNLTLKFAELVHGIDPKVVVWENVPGVLNTKDNAFGYFLAGLVGETDTALFPSERARREWERKSIPVRWANAGMVIGPRRSAAWRVLNAEYFGLAQRRRRVFVVSFRTGDGYNPGAVLFEPESLRRHYPPSREAGKGSAADSPSGIGSYRMRAFGDYADEGFGTLRESGGDLGGCSEMLISDVAPIASSKEGPKPLHYTHDFNQDRIYSVDAVAPAVTAHDSNQSRNFMVPDVYAFQSTQDGGDGSPMPDPTLSVGQTTGLPSPPAISQNMRVRRLTPVECERLQGFPDDYTKYGIVNGETVEISDTQRYKMIGNSMARNVVLWIGKRIEYVITEYDRSSGPPDNLKIRK